MRSPPPLVWLLRAGWLALPVLVGPAVAGAIDGRSDAVRWVAQAGVWGLWALGLVAVLAPATASLTAVRVLAPAAVGAAGLAACTGAAAGWAALALGGSLAVALLAALAEIGLAFAQASAYGDERRFLVRLPSAVLLGPVPVAWLAMAAAVTSGVLLLACEQWVAGGLLTVVGAALVVLVMPRLHRLTQRMVVLVPAGLVIHDPLVLGQTGMLRRPEVAGLGLALAGTDATDLSGGAPGNAVEVRLQRPVTFVLAGTLAERQGHSTQVQHFLVAPSRPGRLLADAAGRGYPVGRPATPPPSTQRSSTS